MSTSIILRVAAKAAAKEMAYRLSKSEDAKWYDYQSNSDSPNRKAIVKKVSQLAARKGYTHVSLYDSSGNHLDTFSV